MFLLQKLGNWGCEGLRSIRNYYTRPSRENVLQEYVNVNLGSHLEKHRPLDALSWKLYASIERRAITKPSMLR